MDVRFVVLFLLLTTVVFGETFKLFKKDGDYHLVREYQVQGNRIRYFSTERGDWEEIPKDLVDLAKTEQQRKAHSEQLVKEARAQDEEDKAERAQQKEIASIPMEPGAYFKPDEKIESLKQAEYQILTDKKRKTLQMISPLPIVPGKATVVIKGEHSGFVIHEGRPEFYLRLAKEERFGIVRLTPKKGMRIVENIAIIAVSNENIEERKQVETFEQQLMGNLYKVWSEKPLPAGEYALMEFSGSEDKVQNDIELLIWDFAVQ
jgi:hypothetical protein